MHAELARPKCRASHLTKLHNSVQCKYVHVHAAAQAVLVTVYDAPHADNAHMFRTFTASL